MAKRRSLSYLLIKLVMINGLITAFLIFSWFISFWTLITHNVILPANHDEHVVQLFVKQQKRQKSFIAAKVPANIKYALFNDKQKLLTTNAAKSEQYQMQQYLHQPRQTDYGFDLVHYSNKTVAVLKYHYLTRYTNSLLQKILPPWEYLSIGIVFLLILLSLILTTLFVRKKFVKSLNIFQQVGENIAQKNLDFIIPPSDIKEFAHALKTMSEMQEALKNSLSSNWLQEQAQQKELIALSHDLKTPLTVIRGNSELLLEDNNLTTQQYTDLRSIIRNTDQASEYLNSMRQAINGSEEEKRNINLHDLQAKVISRAQELVRPKNIRLKLQGQLVGNSKLQVKHILRALINIIENAVRYTQSGKVITLCFENAADYVRINIYDSGSGFSKEALTKATTRFWKEDVARTVDGHSGLGLWFAQAAIKRNNGNLIIKNSQIGGLVIIELKKLPN